MNIFLPYIQRKILSHSFSASTNITNVKTYYLRKL